MIHPGRLRAHLTSSGRLKVAHTPESAQETARLINERETAGGKPAPLVSAYPCPHCDAWHVGSGKKWGLLTDATLRLEVGERAWWNLYSENSKNWKMRQGVIKMRFHAAKRKALAYGTHHAHLVPSPGVLPGGRGAVDTEHLEDEIQVSDDRGRGGGGDQRPSGRHPAGPGDRDRVDHRRRLHDPPDPDRRDHEHDGRGHLAGHQEIQGR